MEKLLYGLPNATDVNKKEEVIGKLVEGLALTAVNPKEEQLKDKLPDGRFHKVAIHGRPGLEMRFGLNSINTVVAWCLSVLIHYGSEGISKRSDIDQAIQLCLTNRKIPFSVCDPADLIIPCQNQPIDYFLV